MELIGVADIAPTLAVRALAERGMPFPMFAAAPGSETSLGDAGVPVSGGFDDLIGSVDIMLDAAPGGIGAKNKVKYEAAGIKAVFQGGEVADVFFHGYANYDSGVGCDYLKLTSCNTTGLIRTIDCLDRAVGIEKVAVTIIRRVADPDDTHRGLVDSLQLEAIPNHQAVDLMHIMPHIDATGLLIHTPVTHGHIITIVATPKVPIAKAEVVEAFQAHPRIRVVRIADGFNTNTSLFNYARFLGHPRGDMFEVGMSVDDIMFAINISQESVVIPETIDGVRAALGMQADRLEAVGLTNRYLGMA